MELYQLIFAFSAAASAVSGSIILLAMATLVIKRAFLQDFKGGSDLSRFYK